jgi:hypothetical protein
MCVGCDGNGKTETQKYRLKERDISLF